MTPTLIITDGTPENTVNLLALHGWLLKDWNPSVPEPKGGGVFRNSPLTDGRKLVFRKLDNVIDTFNLVGNEGSQNDLIASIQKLQRLLEKAVSYWTTDWQNEPVWMEAKATRENSPRYAVIVDYRLTGFGNPYKMPFFNSCDETATEAILALEHTIWQETKPGDNGNCVQLYSKTDYPAVTTFANGTFTPGQSSDDGTYSPTMSLVDIGTHVLGIGYSTHAPYSGKCQSGVIFDNVTVPAGAEIKRATLTVECSAFSSPRVYVQITGQALGGGIINSVTVTNGGSGYHHPKVIVTDAGGSGSGAQITATLFNGAISELTIVNGGSNYVTPILTIKDTACVAPHCGKGATATATATLIGTDATTFSRTKSDFLNRPRTHARATLYVDTLGTATKTVDVTNIVKEIMDTDYWDSGDDLGMFLELSPDRDPLVTDYLEIYAFDDVTEDPPELYVEYTTQVVQTGRVTTCSPEVYVSNKYNKAPVNRIYCYDASAVAKWSPNMYEWDYTVATMPLYQDNTGVEITVAVGDILYYGSCPIDVGDTDYGVFCSLIFDLYQAASGIDGVWEIYTGSWVGLDYCEDIDMFMRTGVGSIVWQQPATWVANDPGVGVTGYWVRFRVTAVNIPVTPHQWHRTIYTVLLPYIDIESEEIPGDIPALARVIYNFAGCEDRASQTLVMGLRSLSRGENFNAYLNASDVQNPDGIHFAPIVSSSSFADDTNAPTGRSLLVDFTGTMRNVGWWHISADIAPEYLGTYHAYLRVKQTTAATGTVKLKLRTKVGYSNIYTDPVAITTGEIITYLDMGQLTIPFAETIIPSDTFDGSVYIALYASIENTEQFYVYDLILIPADEWAASCTAYDEYGNSLYYYGSGVDVDAIRNPKKTRSSLNNIYNEAQKSGYFYSGEVKHIFSNDPIFQANSDQRLWFFAIYTYGSSASYIENCGAIRTERSARYLLARGV